MSRFASLRALTLCFGAAALLAIAAPAAAQTPSGAPATAASAPPGAHPWLPVAGSPSSHDDDGDWHGSVEVYGFLSALNGELRVRDRVVEVDERLGDIVDILKLAGGIRAEARHGAWGFAFDNNYVHIGDDVTTARGIIPDYRYDVAMNVTELEPSYRLYSSGSQDDPVGGPKVAVDVIGGARIVHLSEDIEIRRLVRDDLAGNRSSTYVHGYVGNKFVVSPTKYLSFVGRYNIALASDFSWFVNGTAYVQPWKHVSFGAGLQALDLSLENDSKDAALDARFFGPIVSLGFHF
jgi:hypothetical protein